MKWTVWRRLLLLIGLTLVWQSSAPGQSPDAHRATARQLEAAFNFPAAVRELNRAYDSESTDSGRLTDLVAMGRAQLSAKEARQALDTFQRALTLAKQLRDISNQAISMTDIGVAHDDLFQPKLALSAYQQAMPLWQRAHATTGEILDTNDLAVADSELGRSAEAITEIRSGLALARKARDPRMEFKCLNNLGLDDDGIGKFTRSLYDYQQALIVAENMHDADLQATAYGGLGNEYGQQAQYAAALAAQAQDLRLAWQAHDPDQAANALIGIGAVRDLLGEFPDSLSAYQQGLNLVRKVHDVQAEALTLCDIGAVYDDLGQYAKALDYYRQALPIRRHIGDLAGQATTLTNIAVAQDDLGRFAAALNTHHQALDLWTRIGDRADEATSLNDIGAVYYAERSYPSALDYFRRALVVRRAIGLQDINGQATTLANLMQVWGASDNPRAVPRMAIFYGKKAVNTCQAIRRNMRGLNRQAQQAFLASYGYVYRRLADLLIAQGRLAEAQQALRLLKQQEFYDFLNSGRAVGPLPPAPLDLMNFTPHEAEWTTRMVTVDWTTPSDLAVLETRMAADFAKPATAADTLPDTAQARDLQAALTPGTAALYTIVSPDQLYLILVTAGGKPKVFKPDHLYQDGTPVAYTADALYHQVYALRQALTDPNADPRPQAADLYRVLIGPIKRDIQDAHVHTLLFSLDDALRYVPVAALYDPDTGHYLVQDYASALITLAAAPRAETAAEAARPVSVLAAGVTQGYDAVDPATGQTLDFPDLPGVGQELAVVVREGTETQGLFPGERLENGQFTTGAFESGLSANAFSVVHLASHFALHATAADSYLLLGGGTTLPVSKLEADPNRFAGVDLLTLSACDTDVEVADTKAGTAGREVEGFGALAQHLGARSVLASLWPVSDSVTPDLMASFYGYLKAHPGCALPDAVRWAQLSLLYGHAPSPADGFIATHGPARPTLAAANTSVPPSYRRRGIAADNPPPDTGAPAFTAPADALYAHPFYWAPFVLIGNWR